MSIFRRRKALLSLGAGSAFAGLLFAAFVMQSNPSQSQEQNLQSISKVEIEAAATRRVVFGHQSVGENILDGTRGLARENGVKLNIVETRRPPATGAGIFHFGVQQNGAPMEKISDYLAASGDGAFANVDVALMKLCYVDFNSGSDATAVAKAYTDAVKKLQAAYPSTRFVAVTAPLTAIPGGAKVWVKKMIGKRPPDLEDNAKRREFNEYIRQQFDKNHLFDIAKLEAETATASDGKEIEVMRAELTNDGGHLNDRGKRLVGIAFLKLIAAK